MSTSLQLTGIIFFFSNKGIFTAAFLPTPKGAVSRAIIQSLTGQYSDMLANFFDKVIKIKWHIQAGPKALGLSLIEFWV